MRKWNRNLILAWSTVAIMVIATVVFIIVYNYPSKQKSNENNNLSSLIIEHIKTRQKNEFFTQKFDNDLFSILDKKDFNPNTSQITETKILYQITNDQKENMGFYLVFNNNEKEIKSIFNFIIEKNGVFESIKGVL